MVEKHARGPQIILKWSLIFFLKIFEKHLGFFFFSMGQKYKGEKCIIRAKGVFAKYALREEKMFSFLANLDGSNKVVKFLGQPRPQTRK
jgi:hypothetical protein